MHRILNFIEDLHCKAKRDGLGNVTDIDHYGSGNFQVNYSSRRTLGPLRQLASKLLVRHNLADELVTPISKSHVA